MNIIGNDQTEVYDIYREWSTFIGNEQTEGFSWVREWMYTPKQL